MLREWTEAGYVTRDFSNFIPPVTYAPPEPASPAKTEVLVAVETSPGKPAAPPKALLAAAPRDVGVKTVIEDSPVSTKPKASKGGNLAPIALPPAKTSNEVERPVSINTAAEPELAAVEGLSTKLAQNIIKKRPFSSLDDLRRVKGIGANLLARIRSRLRL
jgi:DNA uptake protein ComE-like DNA-binding protein